MNKTHRVLFSLAFLSGLVLLAQSVEVKLVAPTEGNTWHTGQTVNVSWEMVSLKSSKGEDITQIDLDLFEDSGTNLVANISFGVPVGLKSAEWVVGDQLETGNDYFVRVTSVEDPKFVMMGPRFTIVKNSTKAARKNPAQPKAAPESGMSFIMSFVAFITFLLL
jgi:hypothetical protein